MKTIGIIAEFNPFHNGHKYLIDKAKSITKADNVIVICSGNYVQRGEPAIFDKSVRVKSAISNGADAVFELPVFYSTASAELFAQASVKFLNDLNCIDYLCFGCEADNLKALPMIASILSNEPDEYRQYLSIQLKNGVSFPRARMNALNQYCSDNNILNEFIIHSVMSQSNNILAIEYLKALKKFNSSIKPVAIKRIGADYNSHELDHGFASATGIRKALIEKKDIIDFIPDNSFDAIQNASFMLPNDFVSVLGYKLIHTDNYTEYLDVSLDLSNRINNLKYHYISIDSFIAQLQSKNFTYSGITRALIHILLDIKTDDVRDFINNGYFTYGRLLGFNSNSKILSQIKANSDLDIISKLSTYYNQCSDISRRMLDVCIQSDELYRMIYMSKYKEIIPTEFERQIIIKNA